MNENINRIDSNIESLVLKAKIVKNVLNRCICKSYNLNGCKTR